VATVTVTPVDPPGPAISFPYAGPAQPSGGVGGWDDVARSRRTTAVEWVGTPGRELRVAGLVTGIDVNNDAQGDARDASREPKLQAIEALGLPTEKTGEPPVVKLTGPVLHRGRRWVLDEIEWGTYELNAAGERVKAEFVLVLKQHIAADVILSPAKRSSKGSKGKARTTVVLKSDLRQGLAAVSVRVYGTTKRTAEIAKLNGIRDPKNIRVGQVLRLPS